MKRWPTTRLGDIADIERDALAPHAIRSTSYVGLENIQSGGSFVGVRSVEAGELASNKFQFSRQHLLYGKLRPYLAKIARPHFEGICSTDILPVLPGPKLDRDYLSHFLLTPQMVSVASSLATGANLPRLSPTALADLHVPVPPMSEQRRIAAILNKADALRAKRRAALAQLDALTQAMFLDMFGDPNTNPTEWPVASLLEILALPLRNGLSPSHAGRVTARVLTLSAITGAAFNAEAWKIAQFQAPPRPEQSVRDDDFLICRGNGNPRLVGKGWFPPHPMPDVTFPDTIIAARIDPQRIEPRFLERVWNSTAVRRQVESLARTTNGTYKVNQTMLEAITFIVPSRSLQHEYAERVRGVDVLRHRHLRSLTELDALFASLQHRAFRGEL